MTGNTTKSKLRIEKKKKKMAALLDIAKLNEYDRAQKNKLATRIEDSSPLKPETEPSPKRLRTEEIVSECIENSICAETDPPPLIGEHGPSGRPKVEGDEFIQLKKMLRERTQKIRQSPQFRLRDLGESASLKAKIEERIPLYLSDLQHLIMYSQIGPHSPYSPARWCALEKYSRLVNTNVIILENISLCDFLANQCQFPFLSCTFEHKLEMITPASYNSDIVKDLSMVPLTGTQMKKFINTFGDLESAVIKTTELFDTIKNFFPIEENIETETIEPNQNIPKTDKFPRTQLLLSGWQLVEENFPLPIKGLFDTKFAGYTLTKEKYKDVTPLSPMFAIDCEMCRTSTGDLELTRISAVDENHKVFYDTLVKPDNAIVDYLTKWSGINAKMMKNVTKKLKDVQEDLKKFLPPDAILVGQSLANDLHALKMMHPYIIDTSVIYNITGDRNRKTKLQTLAREFLMEKIQAGHHGHSSEEDSLACMKLVQLRLKKHLYYGDAVMSNVYTEIRAYPDMGTANYATSLLKQCTKMDQKANVVALEEIAQRYKFYVNKGDTTTKMCENISFASEVSNKEVVRKFCTDLQNHSLNLAHIKVTDADLAANGGAVKVYRSVDKWIKNVYENSSSNGSLIAVLFGGQKQVGNGVCFLHLKKDFIV